MRRNPLETIAQGMPYGNPIVAAPQFNVMPQQGQPQQPASQPVQQPQPVAQPMTFPNPPGYIPPAGQQLAQHQAQQAASYQTAAVQQPAAPQIAQQPVAQPAYQAPAAQQPIVPEAPQMVAVTQGATTQEISQACPGAPADFVLQMHEANATVQQAMTAFIQLQQTTMTAQASAAPLQPQQAPQYVPNQRPQLVPQQAVNQVGAIQPAQLPGNMPVAAAQPGHPAGGQQSAEQMFHMLCANERKMLIAQGYDAVTAQRQSVINVNRDNPTLREQMLGG